MNESKTEISFLDLSVIIEGLYYGGEKDFTYTEDLIDYLRENKEIYAVLTATQQKAD